MEYTVYYPPSRVPYTPQIQKYLTTVERRDLTQKLECNRLLSADQVASSFTLCAPHLGGSWTFYRTGNHRPIIAMEIKDDLPETWRELGAAVDGQRGLAFATGFISLVCTAHLNMT